MPDQDSTITHPDPDFIKSLVVEYLGKIDYGSMQQPRQAERVFLLVLALTGRDLDRPKVETTDILDACGIPYAIDLEADRDSDDCILIPDEWLAAHDLDEDWRVIVPPSPSDTEPGAGATMAMSIPVNESFYTHGPEHSWLSALGKTDR